MSEKEPLPFEDKNEIVVYQPEGGEFHIEVRVENETVWLTQAQMAELFNSTRNNITLHIKNIFQEHELDANSVCKESLLTANDVIPPLGNPNVNRTTCFFNHFIVFLVLNARNKRKETGKNAAHERRLYHAKASR